MNRNGTKKLNLKKIVFVKSEEDTWEAFAKDLVAASTSLETIELPKISTVSLHTIVQCAKDSPITRLSSFTGTLSNFFTFFFNIDFTIFFLCLFSASNVSFNDDEPLDLVHIGQLEELVELKLKSASGKLEIDDFSQSLQEFAAMKSETMTKFVSTFLPCF